MTPAATITQSLEKAQRNGRTLEEAVQHLLDIGLILPNPLVVGAQQ